LSLLFALIALVAGFYALGGNEYLNWQSIQERRDEWRSLIHEHWLPALLLCFAIYVTVAGLAVPVTPVLSFSIGAFFGLWQGLVMVSFASTAGATLAFLNSRYLFRELAQRRLGARLTAIDAGVRKRGAYYLMTLRLLPVVPFSLINLGMGLTRMPVWTFWWVSQVGMLPVTLVFVNAGAEFGELRSPQDILTPPLLIALTLLSVVPLVLARAVAWVTTDPLPQENA
jgi:uncharacterized membrane protein YdjX (TVP38/TMEM64 family)